MPSDSYSGLLNLLLMADGNDANTWGDNTNTNLNLLEQAIAQRTSIALSSFSGGNYTLTVLNGAQDDSRAISIEVTGALTSGTGDVTVTFPNIARLYVFDNQCTNVETPQNPDGYTVTATTATPTATYSCLPGQQAIYCDGDGNIYGVSIPVLLTAQLAAYQAFVGGTAWPFIQVGYGANTTIDPSESNNFYMIFGTSPIGTTLAITNSQVQLDGQTIQFLIQQSSTGGGTITWPGDVVWEGGEAPTLTAVANGVDIVTLLWDAAASAWFGSIKQGYNPGAAGSQKNVTISQNCVDWSLKGIFPGLTGTPTVNVTVAAGVVVSASTPTNAALNLYDAGIPSGATINLIVYGQVIGKGGQGGDGIAYNGSSTVGYATFTGNNSLDGGNGGTAVVGPGSGYTFTINVASAGVIAGGGGGGGAGGIGSQTTGVAVSGGGGGGAGCFGGFGGQGVTSGTDGSGIVASTAGGNAPSGWQTTYGAGGTGADVGTASGANGGAGGALGQAGTAGTAAASHAFNIAPGTAGPAGISINNDNATVTIVNTGTIEGSEYINGGSSPAGGQDWPNW